MSALDPEVGEVLRGERRWWVVEGVALAVLARMGDKSVDHTITDPPYSRGLYARTRTNKGSGLRPNGRPVCASEMAGRPDRSAFQLASEAIGAIDTILRPCAKELLRTTRRWVIPFHDCETGDRWRHAFGSTYVRTGAWVKPDPMPQVSGDRPGAGFEPCTIAHARPRGRMRWNGGGLPAVWTHPTSKGDERPDHPCPKPVALMLDLVELFTDPGELVLDPFTGSGTTGVACLRLGRRFLGVEKSPKYAALARERLEAESKGLTLRDARHGQLPLLST